MLSQHTVISYPDAQWSGYETVMDGREKARCRHQWAVQRGNLLGVSKMCIKSLVDKSVFETIQDDCLHLSNFCNVMEHIFTHRIQDRWTFFGSSEPYQYWHVLCHLVPPVMTGSVRDMEGIQTDIGRCRAWVRLALVQKKLASFLTSLLTKTKILKTMYLPGAFLLSDEATELAGTLKCLDAIDFNLCLRGQDFDFGERYQVDYSLYLHFDQSEPGKADDFEEEKKLNSHQAATFPTPSQDNQDESVSVASSVGEESLIQLREMLKTEREQKNYFEELVSVRDTQLSKVQAELRAVSEESEQQKKELGDIILELQQQLEKKQSELREAQRKLTSGERTLTTQEKPPNSPNRRRATSFSALSNLLGHSE